MTNDMIWASYSDQLPGILLITEFFVVFAITVFPLVSAITFVQGLLAHRRGRDTWWQRRILLLAGLLAILSGAGGLSATTYYAFSTRTGGDPLVDFPATMFMGGLRALAFATLAATFCIALALLLPDKKKL